LSLFEELRIFLVIRIPRTDAVFYTESSLVYYPCLLKLISPAKQTTLVWFPGSPRAYRPEATSSEMNEAVLAVSGNNFTRATTLAPRVRQQRH